MIFVNLSLIKHYLSLKYSHKFRLVFGPVGIFSFGAFCLALASELMPCLLQKLII